MRMEKGRNKLIEIRNKSIMQSTVYGKEESADGRRVEKTEMGRV